ncbi:MAG: hypothetical protein ACYDCL_22300 [Myxococcales bacterium]
MKATLRLAAVAALALAGCLTHLHPLGQKQLDIHWATSFAAAQARAIAERKPMLICLVAGQLAGPC